MEKVTKALVRWQAVARRGGGAKWRLRRLPNAGRATVDDAPATGQTVVAHPVLDGRLVVEVATGLWRLHTKMVDRSTGEPADAVRHLHRHVQMLRDALADAGVTTQDHDGMAYDPGLSITVIAFQPTPELEGEQVIETLRPTVYLHGRVLRLGEVIVGTPTRPEAPDSTVDSEERQNE